MIKKKNKEIFANFFTNISLLFFYKFKIDFYGLPFFIVWSILKREYKKL